MYSYLILARIEEQQNIMQEAKDDSGTNSHIMGRPGSEIDGGIKEARPGFDMWLVMLLFGLQLLLPLATLISLNGDLLSELSSTYIYIKVGLFRLAHSDDMSEFSFSALRDAEVFPR